MLYALTPDELSRLHPMKTSELTGAEMLTAAYRTDPAVVARVLPKPLEPTADPVAFAFLASYPKTNFGVAYKEAALLVTCRFRKRTGVYCLSMPVDDDTAMSLGREQLGLPKKMAEITFERSGNTVSGKVVRRGVEILRMEASLEGDAGPEDLYLLGPETKDEHGRASRRLASYSYRSSIRASGKGFDYLPQLIEQVTVFRPRPGLRKGTGEARLSSSPFDPLGEIPLIGAPLNVIHGIWDNTMLPGRVAARAWNLKRFLPHAFFKTDVTPVLLAQDSADGAPSLEGLVEELHGA